MNKIKTDTPLSTPLAELSESGSHAPGAQLQRFPVGFFSMSLGLAGFSLALQRADPLLSAPLHAEAFSAALATCALAVFLVLYVAKALRYPQAVALELDDPMALSFFPAFSFSLLVLSAGLLPLVPAAAACTWAAGCACHLFLTAFVFSRWISRPAFTARHINPSWFIPAAGNLVAPVAGMRFGFTELSWFFFSIGLFFCLALIIIVFYRLVVHPPLPARLVPTLFLLVAPPSLCFSAYLALTGQVDIFARVVFDIALFQALLLCFLWRQFTGLQFSLSWWAYSFPLAAFTRAAVLMQGQQPGPFHLALAYLLLFLLTLVVVGLLARTLWGLARGNLLSD